jgi:DNA-directed RNA polymerase specialized sigma24 family protein
MAAEDQAVRARLVELAEQLGGVDSDRERLRRERDEAIQAAYEAGLTVREIARLAGVSHQRVHQVISA